MHVQPTGFTVHTLPGLCLVQNLMRTTLQRIAGSLLSASFFSDIFQHYIELLVMRWNVVHRTLCSFSFQLWFFFYPSLHCFSL